MKMKLALSFFCTLFLNVTLSAEREPDTVLNLWPGQAPGPAMNVGEETDFTKPTDRLIAGRRIIKLGNVDIPQIHVYRPDPKKSNGASVVIAPGGGFSILAWDLEGTEVAEWLNSLGVTGIVLKYRVPTRNQDPRWLAPTQDTQRAIRLVRHHAKDWQLDPERVGVLGFSAGGKTAAMATVLEEPKYESIDVGDKQSFIPNFSVLVYAAGLANKQNTALLDEITVSPRTPPVFLANAFDDFVRIENALLLCAELKKHEVPCELHVYSEGGHGYGLRINEQPVTTWHHRCAEWMRINGWIGL
ncbi:alpha/beta hydrolase [Verrucomicrobia bacterium]|nr:alpha/beta hydrolase [Verrucomicrobiota bacterium]